ncbi:MAG: haloacid dehalogenase-like hydrolase, partial [Methanothrix sp.]|nr:haloacid dehalogenase-like hydrolase [Methanothrix sp.]
AYGNSDGDIPMLKFATSYGRYSLGLLNRHDDPVREFAYNNTTAVGKLDSGLALAGQMGWLVVSMKDDWKEMF